jgi:hypothetical protein
LNKEEHLEALKIWSQFTKIKTISTYENIQDESIDLFLNLPNLEEFISEEPWGSNPSTKLLKSLQNIKTLKTLTLSSNSIIFTII